MKNLIALLFVFVALASQAQLIDYLNYNWKKTPQKFEITSKDKEEDVVVLFEKKAIIMVEGGEEFYQKSIYHSIKVVNNDAGIQSNNKVYITNPYGATVEMQKARVIKPDGSILELKDKDIQEQKGENNEIKYRYFALEGLEPGCIIEYIHCLKEEPSFSGASIYVQNELVKKRVEIDLIYPKHLDFQTYCINNMPDFKTDTSSTQETRKYMYVDNVEGIADEDWSPYSASVQKAYYKLNKNLNTGKGNFYTYINVSKRIYENLFEVHSKKALKTIKTLVSDAEKGGTTLEQKLRALEYAVKSTYGITEDNMEDIENLDKIFERKVTNTAGLTKIMIQALTAMNVKFELVMTSDRDVDPFITEFEGYNFLDEYLIYIPELKMYWEPGLFSRLGFPSYEYTFNKGLFIEERTINEVKTPVSKIKYIEGPAGSASVDEINTTVTFNGDITEPIIGLERIATGYKAQFPQYVLDFMDDEGKKEAKEDFLTYLDDEAVLENVVYKNDNSKDAGSKPFMASCTFKGSNFIEKAGDQFLLKAGLLIGPQAQMYNKKERKLPVQAQYQRQYKRKIEIEIPAGYTVKNPEALVINVRSTDEQKSTGFISNYTVEGNKIIVTVDEFYNKVFYPVEEYKNYETVMNAAADFNKIVLVFQKL